jgi:hypothetical protein
MEVWRTGRGRAFQGNSTWEVRKWLVNLPTGRGSTPRAASGASQSVANATILIATTGLLAVNLSLCELHLNNPLRSCESGLDASFSELADEYLSDIRARKGKATYERPDSSHL